MPPITHAIPDWMRQLSHMPLTRWAYRALMTRIRRLRRILAEIWRDEYCGMNLNWHPAARRWDHMAGVHWCHTRILWQKNKSIALVTSMIWPFCSLVFICKRVAQYGKTVRQKFGVPVLQQLWDLVYLTNVLYMGARTYYFYGLHDPKNMALAPLYVQDHEIMALLDQVNSTKDIDIFESKMAFFRKCRQFGLKTLSIIAYLHRGEVAVLDRSDCHCYDLFAKPEYGKCGNGALVFEYSASGQYRSGEGSLLTKDELIDFLAGRSWETPYLLQKRVFNHPSIARLSTGALCTCRVVTYRTIDGSVGHLPCSIFKMSTGRRCTDNFHTEGMAVPIDPETGVLGKGIIKADATRRLDTHPDTQMGVSGFQLPFWTETLALCLEAHRIFNDYAFIGWDVAITDEGPALVEGNLFWGVEAMQMAHETPLGMTLFPRIYLSHMRHRGGCGA